MQNNADDLSEDIGDPMRLLDLRDVNDAQRHLGSELPPFVGHNRSSCFVPFCMSCMWASNQTSIWNQRLACQTPDQKVLDDASNDCTWLHRWLENYWICNSPLVWSKSGNGRSKITCCQAVTLTTLDYYCQPKSEQRSAYDEGVYSQFQWQL